MVLRRPVESAQYNSEQFQRLMADSGVACSMCRSGNCWDNSAMESFFSSLKTERVGRKVYRSRNEARADVFDYVERFYNPTRRHSTIGYKSLIDFERDAGVTCTSLSSCPPNQQQASLQHNEQALSSNTKERVYEKACRIGWSNGRPWNDLRDNGP